MKIEAQWELPKPPKAPEKLWEPVVRIGRTVPFGYKQDENDPDILLPIPEELEFLEQAKKHLKKYSYREVANWLSLKSGRTISHEGLRKRVKLESRRYQEATNARLYAEKAKAAAEKAKKLSKRYGGTKPRVETSGG